MPFSSSSLKDEVRNLVKEQRVGDKLKLRARSIRVPGHLKPVDMYIDKSSQHNSCTGEGTLKIRCKSEAVLCAFA